MKAPSILLADDPAPPRPIRIQRVKVAEITMHPEEIQREWMGFMDAMNIDASERRALRQLPKRLGRAGRKQLRAKLIRAGHYTQGQDKPLARITMLKRSRTYPYPRNARNKNTQ